MVSHSIGYLKYKKKKKEETCLVDPINNNQIELKQNQIITHINVITSSR